ncbi:alpha/beta hydrolase [Kaistella jeonii]|uniref:Alpha-dextran endo-1,6-alpha-glucosidase n=1 Tax=Kaistella jeonii TaxID=266749 RepID=A0A0C1F4V4_9FLAO|nr:alpha/beta hydrolase-fold protein [Kaistella jeonii]KIA88202.1 alpha-dextran endo-1,6-alpha-glucosidase [Kaistella jeonii]SFC25732.1 Predicted hydrolase of the alpha/beta superfamily [Kaistella jeonii]VEI95665.1 Endo-1,4-beta-xylanase Z precursor [Kaistella jeonii]
MSIFENIKLYSVIFVMMCTNFQSQVHLKITSIPKGTPENTKIFMANSLNNWNPNDPNFELKKDSSGNYTLQIPEYEGTLEYKFTQGNWETAEGDVNGNKSENRKFHFNGNPQTIENQILSWEHVTVKQNTASNNVKILSENFSIPQLKTTRRIWIYFPPDYSTSNKKYPVIYMQDAQNLFNDASSFSGEWKVDETLNQLFAESKLDAIVVGIENGGAERLNEYSPWKNTKYGGGKGDSYTEFLAKTLKPYIDKTYRTLPQAKNTALIGSSMGGLISFYAGLKYPEKFGKLGIFSPSFWFDFKDLNFFINKNSKKLKHTKFYFLSGTKESEDMVSDIQKIIPILIKKGVPKENIKTKFDEEGTHSESYWSREFGAAYLWLFTK